MLSLNPEPKLKYSKNIIFVTSHFSTLLGHNHGHNTAFRLTFALSIIILIYDKVGNLQQYEKAATLF